MESVWQSTLKSRRWPDRACVQFKFCLANSTLSLYNGYISKYVNFCDSRGARIDDEPLLVEFLCNVSDGSDRPKSALICAKSALGHLFNAQGMCDMLSNPWIKNLTTALVKSGTKEARRRSSVIPTGPIRELLSSWPDNESLDTKRLRQKCITAMALSLMLRPSDLSPKGLSYCSSTGLVSAMIFERQHVTFREDGSAAVTFLGIKNDTLRDGFTVTLTPSSDPVMCPVSALSAYMSRTAPVAPHPCDPVFVALRRPFKALSAQAVASVLNATLAMCNMHEYSAKDFRPTGATLQVRGGVDPKTVMKVGRWKTESVFFDHYVHSEPPAEFSDNVLLSV